MPTAIRLIKFPYRVVFPVLQPAIADSLYSVTQAMKGSPHSSTESQLRPKPAMVSSDTNCAAKARWGSPIRSERFSDSNCVGEDPGQEGSDDGCQGNCENPRGKYACHQAPLDLRAPEICRGFTRSSVFQGCTRACICACFATLFPYSGKVTQCAHSCGEAEGPGFNSRP